MNERRLRATEFVLYRIAEPVARLVASRGTADLDLEQLTGQLEDLLRSRDELAREDLLEKLIHLVENLETFPDELHRQLGHEEAMRRFLAALFLRLESAAAGVSTEPDEIATKAEQLLSALVESDQLGRLPQRAQELATSLAAMLNRGWETVQ